MSDDVREEVLDTRGQLCPKPFIELVKILFRVGEGGVIRIYTDDESCIDYIPKHVEEVGLRIESIERREGFAVITIRVVEKIL
ncbi:MAG: sulfurtransferase TusA family protein [Sulfolobales archaeon]